MPQTFIQFVGKRSHAYHVDYHPQLIAQIGLRQIEHSWIRVQVIELRLMQFRSELNKSRIRFVFEEFLEPQLKRVVLKGVRDVSVGNTI